MRRRCLAALCLLLVLCLLPVPGLMQGSAAGETFTFGSYPADAQGGRQPITWRVLSISDGRALLLSQEILDARAVQPSGNYDGFKGSELAAWLNKEFAEAAFTAAERQALIAQDGQLVSLPSADDLRNRDYGFRVEADRRAKGTAWAHAQGLGRFSGGFGSYWIADRSQSSANAQRRILNNGSYGYTSARSADVGLRPMILLPEALLRGAQLAEAVLPAAEAQAPSPAEAAASAPEAAPTASPAPDGGWASTGHLMTEGFPQLTAEGFLPEGAPEYIFTDEAAGVWRYASESLRIVINRVQTKVGRQRLRYLAAHIFVREGAESLRMYAHDADHLLESRALYRAGQHQIARNHGLVLSINSDYYLYRISNKNQQKGGNPVGLVVRNGKLLLEDPPSPKRTLYPPLDMMAMFDNGDIQVFKANELTGQELVARGARDVLSFGPWLVRDGVVNHSYTSFGATPQPRTGVGMFARGHYLAVIAEGRIRESNGLSTEQFAQLFLDLGCNTAFNLDGGRTCSMVFMGKQINQLDSTGVRNNARQQNEVLGIGHTSAYPEDKKR